METNKDIQELTPLYYVRHPDDSYSVADPQPAPVAAAAMLREPTEEDYTLVLADAVLDEVMKERDHCQEIADRLAEAIGKYFNIDIGEHTSAHCPWMEALDEIEERCLNNPPADAAPVDAKPFLWLALWYGDDGFTDKRYYPYHAKEDAQKEASLRALQGFHGVDVIPLYAAQPSPAQGDALSQEAKPVGRVIRDANGFWYFAPLIDWPAIGKVELYAAPPSQPVLTDAQIVVARAVRDAIFCTGNPCTTDYDLRRAILAAASTQADSKEG